MLFSKTAIQGYYGKKLYCKFSEVDVSPLQFQSAGCGFQDQSPIPLEEESILF